MDKLFAELKQHALLLSLLIVLLFAKFIIVPVINWQENLNAEIQLLEKKQKKITQVLAKKADNIRLSDQLSAFIKPSKVLFFEQQEEAAFKLEQQKMIEALLSKHKLQAQNVGWQVNSILDELALIRYSLKFSFTGDTIDFIRFVTEIESMDKLIEAADLNMSLKGQRAENLGRIVNGSLTLNMFVNNKTEISQ